MENDKQTKTNERMEPLEMFNEYYTPYDEMAKNMQCDESIKREMEDLKENTLMHMSFNFSHFQNEIALMIAYSYFEDYEPAKKIVKEMNLSKLDLLALASDFEEFKSLYLENMRGEFHE